MKNKEDNDIIYTDKSDKLENIQDLRSRTFSENNEPDLKKNFLGGYDSKEVKEYINNLSFQHNRTISAYQERIDEFTTFVEMLNKEKEDVIKNYKNNDEEINELKDKCVNFENEVNSYKEEIAALKDNCTNFENETNTYKHEIAILKDNCTNFENEVNTYKNEITKIKEISINFENEVSSHKEEINRLSTEKATILSEYTEKMKELESDFGISKENELLKDEINSLSVSMDNIQSENSILKTELDTTKDDLEKTKLDNKKLRDEIASLHSQMRRYRMNQNMKIIEFSEKETYILNRSKYTLQNLIEDIQKITDDTVNLKKITGEESED